MGHFTPLAMATVLLAGLISRALLVGFTLPSSFEDWSFYALAHAYFCGLFGLYGALFEHHPSFLPLGCGLSVLYGQVKWPFWGLFGLILLFVTRVAVFSTVLSLSFGGGEERWSSSCCSPLGYLKLFDTSSPSSQSVLSCHLLMSIIRSKITLCSVALDLSLHLPVVFTQSSSGSLASELKGLRIGEPSC